MHGFLVVAVLVERCDGEKGTGALLQEEEEEGEREREEGQEGQEGQKEEEMIYAFNTDSL